MSSVTAEGSGTKQDPWVLKTPPGSSEYLMYRDEAADPPALVCVVGKTTLGYQLRAIEDLHAWLQEQGDWVPLGAADEQKPAADGTVEAWGRSSDNPVGGWYGLKKGLRGRFGMYMPPLLEALVVQEPGAVVLGEPPDHLSAVAAHCASPPGTGYAARLPTTTSYAQTAGTRPRVAASRARDAGRSTDQRPQALQRAGRQRAGEPARMSQTRHTAH